MRARPRLQEERSETSVVSTVADRAFAPAKSLLEEVGDMMILTGKTLVSALRPPYPYGSGAERPTRRTLGEVPATRSGHANARARWR